MICMICMICMIYLVFPGDTRVICVIYLTRVPWVGICNAQILHIT